METGQPQRWWPPLLAGTLVAGVAVLAMFVRPAIRASTPRATHHANTAQHANAPGPIDVSPAAVRASTGSGFPVWLAIAILTFIGIAIAIAAILLIIYFARLAWTNRRLRLASSGLPAELNGDAGIIGRDEVLAAVDAGIAELIGDGIDPRAAVIACWVRLEQVAADVGIPRAPGETPSDLVARLLTRQQISPDVLTSLAELYRIARYSSRVIESSMRDAAREALGRLRTELMPRPPVGVAGP